MKTYLVLIILLAALMPSFVSAQDAREDVIYLKNGTIYRGTMLDQNYGVSYKIQISGGSVIAVDAKDIDKITKEAKPGSNTPHAYTQEEWEGSTRGHRAHSPRGYKDKGGFFEAQINGQYGGGGARLVAGYKINQFAFIGLGLGFDAVYKGANNQSIGGDPSPYSAVYFPFFIHYSGDILKKNITPFYELDAGYSFAVQSESNGYDVSYYGGVINTTSGGPMGSVGFGMRLYKGRAFVFTLAAVLGMQYARTEVENYNGNNYGQPTATIYSHSTLLLPGLKIGLGFVK